MKTYYIYTLANPNNREIFYVGCTVNTEQRLGAHTINFKKAKAPRYGQTPKINYILHHKIVPVLEVIEEVECESKWDAEKVELYWIQQFKAWGFTLMNIKGPGPGRTHYLASMFAEKEVPKPSYYTNPDEELLRTKDASERFGISIKDLRAAALNRQITYYRWSNKGAFRFRVKDVAEYVSKQTSTLKQTA